VWPGFAPTLIDDLNSKRARWLCFGMEWAKRCRADFPLRIGSLDGIEKKIRTTFIRIIQEALSTLPSCRGNSVSVVIDPQRDLALTSRIVLRLPLLRRQEKRAQQIVAAGNCRDERARLF